MNIKRMAIMLTASAVVFGGVLGFVQFRQHMIAQYFASMPKPVIPVTTEQAKSEKWQDSVSAIGTLAAVNGVDISASTSGLVTEIGFQSGQAVKKGQMLLRLDADVERANLRSAQAEADLARLSADRQRKLVRSDAVSQSAVDKAEAELKVKEANATGLRAQIDKKQVHAPFDGVLGVRKVDLGQFIQAGTAIVNLQDLSVMLADFSVSQRDLALTSVGRAIRMTTDAWPDRVFEGVIAAVEPQVDAKTGMVLAQARFLNTDGALRPGMFARIEILRPDMAEVVTVPMEAVSYNLHGDAVFIVKDGADGPEAARQVVQLGERKAGRVVVLKGLEAGAQVVTTGQLKLENGSKVQVSANDPLKQAAKAE